MGPGTVFGEVGLFDHNRRTADVWAIMASHFALKIQYDTELVQHLG